MDNNDSSLKPQQTGGLKLMTVFIAVLALHVLVIGGFTVYHLMSGGSNDADLTLDKTHKLKADGTAITDTTATDTAGADKSTGTTTPSTDTASATGTTTASSPAPEATAPAGSTASSSSTIVMTPSTTPPAPTLNSTAIQPATSSSLVINGDDVAQTPAIAPGLAPPPEPTLAPSLATSSPKPAPVPAPASSPVTPPASVTPPAPTPASAPDASIATGPVHMPAVAPKPAPSTSVLSTSPAIASTPAHVTKTHELKKETYTVKITDSYKKIAQAHHVTVAQLKEANHIKDDVLHTGQKLIIPSGKTSLAKSEKPAHSGASSESEMASTTSLSLSPETSPSTHHHVYTIVKGDTLKKIAKKFNTTTSALKEANNLTGSTTLTIGQKLKIPSKESRSVTARMPSPPQPSQVETQPAPVAEPAPAPLSEPAPSPTPAASPELANMTF